MPGPNEDSNNFRDFLLCQRLCLSDSSTRTQDIKSLIELMLPVCKKSILPFKGTISWDEEDLLNEFLIHVLLSTPPTISQYNGKWPLKAWGRRVCVNLCIDRVRKMKQPVIITLDDPSVNLDWTLRVYDLGIEDIYGQNFSLDYDSLMKCIEKMPHRPYREIIRMKFLDEMSNKEIAIAMNQPLLDGPNPLANFNNTIRHAKSQLRDVLINEGYGPINR